MTASLSELFGFQAGQGLRLLGQEDRNPQAEKEQVLGLPQVVRFEADERGPGVGLGAQALHRCADVLKLMARQLEHLAGVVEQVFGHSQSPSVARVATRYVAGAFLVARQRLQRRAWVRRAAVIPRPSGTTGEVGA